MIVRAGAPASQTSQTQCGDTQDLDPGIQESKTKPRGFVVCSKHITSAGVTKQMIVLTGISSEQRRTVGNGASRGRGWNNACVDLEKESVIGGHDWNARGKRMRDAHLQQSVMSCSVFRQYLEMVEMATKRSEINVEIGKDSTHAQQ